MQKIFLSILLIFSLTTFSQENSLPKKRTPYPRNFIDLGIGLGPNYGIIGGRAIFGYKGSGLLVGAGTLNGLPTFTIGGQYSKDFFFASLVYGPIGSYEINYYGDISKGILKGTVFQLGGRINLLKSKLMFLELGVGFFNGYQDPEFVRKRSRYADVRQTGFIGNIGLNFRIGKWD